VQAMWLRSFASTLPFEKKKPRLDFNRGFLI